MVNNIIQKEKIIMTSKTKKIITAAIIGAIAISAGLVLKTNYELDRLDVMGEPKKRNH